MIYDFQKQQEKIKEISLNRFNINCFVQKRDREYVDVRNMIIYILSNYSGFCPINGYTSVYIAKLFNKDHTTILHNKKTVQDYISYLSLTSKKQHDSYLNGLDSLAEDLQAINLCLAKNDSKLKNILNLKMEVLERLEMVRDFNTIYKVPMFVNSEIDRKGFNTERLKLRKDLLIEEFEELENGIKKNNQVEIADALGDLFYVALGGVLDVANNIDLDFINEYKSYSNVPVDELIIELGIKINTIKAENSTGLILSLRYHSILLILEQIANRFNFNLHNIFVEIHLSNMSKLGEDGKPLYRADGKVLKGKNYFKPNIEKVLKLNAE